MRFLVFAPEQHTPLSEGIQKSAWASVVELRAQGHVVDIVSQTSYGTPPETPYILNLSVHKNRWRKYCAWMRQAVSALRIYTKGNYDSIIVFSVDLSFILPLLGIRFFRPHTHFSIAVFGARECKGIPGLTLRLLRRAHVRTWCASPRVRELLEGLEYSLAQIFCAPIFFTESFLKEPTHPTTRDAQASAYLSSADAGAGLETILHLAQVMPERKWIIAIRKFSDDKEASIREAIASIETLHLPNLFILRTIPDMTSFLLSVGSVILPPTHEDATMAAPLVALEAHHLKTRVFMRNLPVFTELFAKGIAIPFNSERELIENIQNKAAAQSATIAPLSSFISWLIR